MKTLISALLILLLAGPLWAGQTTISLTGTGGANWTPLNIASLVNWYDISTYGLANDASITTMTDTQNANNMTTGQTPATYKTNQQNGLSTALFSGTGVYYTTGGSAADTYPYTIWAVVKVADYTAARTIVGANSGGDLTFKVTALNGYLALDESGQANIGEGDVAVGTTAYHIVIATVDSENWHTYIDTSSDVAGQYGTHSRPLIGGSTFRIGANVSSELFSGYIGEIGICNAVLSSGDRGSLVTYLKAKWDIP